MDSLLSDKTGIKTLSDVLKEAQMIQDDMLAQQTHTKKEITDIAIKKIPYVAYPGISEAECLRIREFAILLLQTAKDENNHNEVTLTYSLEHLQLKNGLPYSIVMGDEHSTDLMADPDTYHIINTSKNNVIVNMHNHPSGYPFSIYDIPFFLQYDSIKLMVLLDNQGKISYMNKNDEYSRRDSILFFQKCIKETIPFAIKDKGIDMSNVSSKQMLSISKQFCKNASTLGIDYKFSAKDKERSRR